MTRPLLTDRPKKVTLSLPTSVFNQVHLLLLDPLRARTRYGKLSGLVTSLLYKWLEDQRKEASDDGSLRKITGPESEGSEERGRVIGRVRNGTDGTEAESPDSSSENNKDEETLEFT